MMINTDLDLPVGWRVARFDQVLKRVERKVILDDATEYDCVGVRWYGQGAFVRERLLGMNIARKQQWLINQGDIVYNKLFAWKGAFAIADALVDGCIVSDKFPTYATDESLLDPRYLAYYFRAPQLARQAQDLSKGAAAISKLTLNPPQFWDLTIPLPPLAEQRRIVARIEALAARIAEARGLRRQAMEEVEALLRSVLAGQFERLAASITPVRLDGVAECRLGKMLSQESKTGMHSTPYLRNANVQWDRLDLSSVYEMDFDEEDRKTFELRAGDILICEGGDIGKAAIWNDEIPGCCYQKALHRVRVNRDVLIPRFALYQVFWHAQEGHYDDIKIQTTIAHLTGVKLKATATLVPPIPEQRRIVAYLDDLQARTDALKRLQAESAAELDALLPSILDQAFKGEL